MKQFLALCLAVVLCLTLVPVAQAEKHDNGGLYVAGKAGIGFIRGDKKMSNNQTSAPTNDETKWSSSGLSYGAAVGWNWMDAGVPIRTEFEFYDHGQVKMTHEDDNATFDVSADIQTVLFNFYYDFYTDTRFIPYLGAGVGMANVKSSGKSKTNVSYGLYAGAAYKMTDSLLLDMQYRINHFGEVGFDWQDTNNSYSGKIQDLYSIEAVLGLRYQF